MTEKDNPPMTSRRKNGVFHNPSFPGLMASARRREVFRWMLTRKRDPDPDPRKAFPIRRNADLAAPTGDGVRMTWVGHSTLLIQAGGRSILTDPMFSARCFPVQWAGPKRAVPPGVPFRELPPIDAVVVSHAHYDHLDDATIRRLGPRSAYLVPKGLGPWMRKRGLNRIREMDWWYEEELLDLKVTCLPAQHFSARTPFDTNKSLWCSWMIEVAGWTIYFGGDSGYFPGYRQIAARFPSIDVAALPIGAWKPRFVMKPVHLNPPEAVQAFRDLGARHFVPIHWGTFKLTDEALDQPPRALRKIWEENQLPPERLVMLAHGESRLFERPATTP